MTAQTAKQLEKQLLALGIPDWATARYLMSEAAAMLRSQAAEIKRLRGIVKDMVRILDSMCVISPASSLHKAARAALEGKHAADK